MYIMGIYYGFPFQVLLTDNRKFILSSFLLNKKIIKIIKKLHIEFWHEIWPSVIKIK